MISEFLLNIVFNIVSGMFSALPDVTWSVGTTAFEYFFDIICVVGYLLPWHTVVAIVSIIIWLSVFRICVSVIKSIWDLLPFV